MAKPFNSFFANLTESNNSTPKIYFIVFSCPEGKFTFLTFFMRQFKDLFSWKKLKIHSQRSFGDFAALQHEKKPLKNESFTLLAGVCLSRFGETTTSCPVCSDPTGVDCTNEREKKFTWKLVTEIYIWLAINSDNNNWATNFH